MWFFLGLTACESQRSARYPTPYQQGPYGAQPGQTQPGQYGPSQSGQPGQSGAAQPGPAAPGYAQPAPAAGGGVPSQAAPAPPPTLSAPVANDPLNNGDAVFMRNRVHQVHQILVAALDPTYRAKVASIPLVFDNEVGSVNAFAGCTSEGKSLVAVTDGLLDVSGQMAQAKATDDVFGTTKLQEYIRYVAQNQRPNQPVLRAPVGFFTDAQWSDARKVARQHQVFDEEVAFIVAHELAHHYLNHLPCTAQGGLGAGEIARVLSGAIPAFNQPNEIAADVSGTQNVLKAGLGQTAYRWTEGGGLVTLEFFSGLDQWSPIDILFGFERSHPPPGLRMPIVSQTASTWRATGGQVLPFPLAL